MMFKSSKNNSSKNEFRSLCSTCTFKSCSVQMFLRSHCEGSDISSAVLLLVLDADVLPECWFGQIYSSLQPVKKNNNKKKFL